MINSTALYKPKANFRTYLFTIAHSTLVDFYRKTKPTQTIGFEDAGITEDLANNLTALAMPEDIFILKQKARQLMQALDKLPSEQKETAVIHFEQEIAKITKIKIETAKSRLRYAKNKLKAAVLN